MKHALWLWLLCSLAHAASCPSGQAKDEGALVEIEHRWALALEQGEAATLGCFLAEEFEDAGPDGQLANRAATLARAVKQDPARSAVHHELSQLHAHVEGDFAYTRGLATAVNLQGKVVRKVRFTDVYWYRDGRWQCVAAHESRVADPVR